MKLSLPLIIAAILFTVSCNSSKDLLRHGTTDREVKEGFTESGEEVSIVSASKFDSTLLKQAEAWMQEPLPERTKEIKYPIGLEPGNLAPNIVMSSPEGKEYSLWDMEGKMVIVDFWASWCAPCRVNNSYLSDIYNRYRFSQFTRGRGLTIYSVSLDNKRDAWVKAIQRDDVPWPYHVSDLSGWDSMIALDYNLRQLPSYYILDREGVVIAKDIQSPRQLEQILKQYKL